MAYDPREKFVQPAEGIHVLSEGLTDAEIREAQARIAAGEDQAAVWADVDARVEARERQRLGVSWPVRSDG